MLGGEEYTDMNRRKIDNTFRTGAHGTPRELRNGRMPFRRAELADDETTVAVFSKEHGLNPDRFRKKVRANGVKSIRQVTSEKVYLEKDLDALLPNKKQDKTGE